MKAEKLEKKEQARRASMDKKAAIVAQSDTEQSRRRRSEFEASQSHIQHRRAFSKWRQKSQFEKYFSRQYRKGLGAKHTSNPGSRSLTPILCILDFQAKLQQGVEKVFAEDLETTEAKWAAHAPDTRYKAIKRLYTNEDGFVNLEIGDLVIVQNKFADTGHFSGILLRNDSEGPVNQQLTHDSGALLFQRGTKL